MSVFTRLLGLCVILISFYYLGNLLWQSKQQLVNMSFNFITGIGVLALAVIYATAMTLLSGTWGAILSAINTQAVNQDCVTKIYARTQIAKYIPGNVFHLVSRVMMAEKLSLTRTQVTQSLLIETVCLLLAAMVLIVPSFWLLPDVVNSFFIDRRVYWFAIVISIGSFVCLLLGPSLLNRFTNSALSIKGVVKWVGYYSAFFVICGIILILLLWLLERESSISLLSLAVFGYSLAWIIGYITPGSSAGIGVREAALTLILSQYVSVEVAIYTSFLLRIVTTLGDVLYFVYHGKLSKSS